MTDVSLAEAKAHLSELVTKAAAGTPISITRRGRTVAQLVQARPPRKPIVLAELRTVTASMPPHDGRPETVRRMRDDDRY